MTHQLLGVLGLEETFILTTALRKTKLSNKLRCTSTATKWNFSTCIFFGEANPLGLKNLDVPSLRDASGQQVEHTLAALTQVHGSCWLLSVQNSWDQVSQNASVATKSTHEMGDLLCSPSRAEGFNPSLLSHQTSPTTNDTALCNEPW